VSAAREQVHRHWDRVAELISQGPRSTSQALDRFWQALPGLLEETHLDWREECLSKQAELDELKVRLQQLTDLQAQQQELIGQTSGELERMYSSSSYRITAPLRSIRRGFRYLLRRWNRC
jgi:lipopolysaccharide transport system ATP-binding protein